MNDPAAPPAAGSVRPVEGSPPSRPGTLVCDPDGPPAAVRVPHDAPPHLTPRPVSVTVYQRYGCRCQSCKDVNAAYQRDQRRKGHAPSGRVRSATDTAAATWVRRNLPEVYAQLLDEQYARLGVQRPADR